MLCEGAGCSASMHPRKVEAEGDRGFNCTLKQDIGGVRCRMMRWHQPVWQVVLNTGCSCWCLHMCVVATASYAWLQLEPMAICPNAHADF